MPQLMSYPTPPGEMTPVLRIEGGNPSDRKAIAPMAVRHAERIAADARQAGDIGDLIEHAAVHRGQNGFGRINTSGYQHAGLLRRGNFPDLIVDLVNAIAVEVSRHVQTYVKQSGSNLARKAGNRGPSSSKKIVVQDQETALIGSQ